MNIQSISDIASAVNNVNAYKTQSANNALTFGDFLQDAVDQTNYTDANDKASNISFLAGEAESIHDVTIAGTKAEIALQLTLEIRNKLVDAYNEIMRMQV